MLLIVLMCAIIIVAESDKYGYLPQCPGSYKPLHITEKAADKFMFAVLQIHEPATNKQISYLHRRRYLMSRAAKGIGTDTEVDFKRRKTMVFMDGYMDSAHGNTVRFFIGNFAAEGYNTIAVDAQAPYSNAFPLTVRVTYQVGNLTAMLLRDLMSYGLRARDIEVVGISLGGQVTSLVAKHFKRLTGQKVGRIFAMDPGGPCYRGLSSKYRLTPSDVHMVQVIHTGIDGFGMANAMGHVDFYINGGEWQQLLNTDQPVCDELCSHLMSSVFLYSSIRLFPDKFVGIKCKSVQQAREHKCYDNYPFETNVIGFKADPGKPGIYYVPATGHATFFAPDDWMEKKPIYPTMYSDALSNVEHFVLAKRSLDLNLSPPEFVNKKL